MGSERVQCGAHAAHRRGAFVTAAVLTSVCSTAEVWASPTPSKTATVSQSAEVSAGAWEATLTVSGSSGSPAVAGQPRSPDVLIAVTSTVVGVVLCILVLWYMLWHRRPRATSGCAVPGNEPRPLFHVSHGEAVVSVLPVTLDPPPTGKRVRKDGDRRAVRHPCHHSAQLAQRRAASKSRRRLPRQAPPAVRDRSPKASLRYIQEIAPAPLDSTLEAVPTAPGPPSTSPAPDGAAATQAGASTPAIAVRVQEVVVAPLRRGKATYVDAITASLLKHTEHHRGTVTV